MDRINGKNTVDIGGGRRGFRNQNAVAGIPGTQVTAEHMNAVQEELMAVIAEAGLTPDPNDLRQLAKAIGKGAFPESAWSINWTAVVSMETAIPPDNAAAGDVYLIPANATGAWAGKSGQLAIAQQTGWIYARPKDGHGFALPDGRFFIRQKGSYKEIKFDASVSRLAELTDIDNAKAAAVRAILTKAAAGKGFTFLSPQQAFDGVKVPVDNVTGLDLSKLAQLDKPNVFLENNTFKSQISVSQTATFMSSVSAVALNVGGTATFAGALTANGAASFNKGITIADSTVSQFPYANFSIQDHTKNGGGIAFVPKSDANSKVEIAYLAGGGLRVFTPDGGDILTIDKSGFLTIQGSGIQWGKGKDGWPARVASDGNISGKIWFDTFGGDASDKNNGWAAGRIRDFIERECVREMKTSGYWSFSGWETWESAFGPRVVTWCKSQRGNGIYGVVGLGVRDLLYRVGSDWRAPWIG